MARAHEIMVNGRHLDPKRAARTILPNDTWLVCPKCDSREVAANEPRCGIMFQGEEKDLMVPRQQDRWCVECSHRWMVVLPPLVIAKRNPYAG